MNESGESEFERRDHVVLLVEDNPDDELLTRRAFRKSRLANDLVVMRDGVEALEFLLGSDGEGGGRRCPDAYPTSCCST